MPEMTPDPLEGFPVVLSVAVAWGEMDSYAHVNNTVYFRWFESARIAYFDRVGFRDLDGLQGIGPILASTACRFRRPLTYPDTIQVGARISALELDRFTMEYRITNQAGVLVAEGTGVVVSYNYREGKKAPVPSAVADRIKALERM